MKLAEGRPLRRRMMAAMAQQDCGQCGYNCQDYSDALFAQEGGAAEPVRAGRQGHRPHAQDALRGDRRARRAARAGQAPRLRAARGWHPAPRRRHARATIRSRRAFVSRTRLNKPGSDKETWHVEFDLAGSGLDYVVGDSFGIFPTNDPALVDAVIAGARRAGRIFRSAARTLREVLIDGVSLAPAPDMLFQLFSYITGGERRQKAQGAGGGRGPRRRRRRRSTCSPRSRNSPACGPIRRPSSRRSIRCSRGSIRSPPRPRSIPAASALTVDTVRYAIRPAHAARRRLDLPRRARRARRQGQGLRAEGAALRAAGRSRGADHHDRARHRRRAVPRLPARAHGDQGARPQLAVLRPPAHATTTSSTRTSSPA